MTSSFISDLAESIHDARGVSTGSNRDQQPENRLQGSVVEIEPGCRDTCSQCANAAKYYYEETDDETSSCIYGV